MTSKNSYRTHAGASSGEAITFSDRINIAASRAGGVTNLAKKMGMSTSVLRSWRSGRSEPSRQSLIKMAAAGEVDLTWLATGDGCMQGPIWFGGEDGGHAEAPAPDDYAPLPLYDVQAAAGHGPATAEGAGATSTLMFKRSWIHHELRAQPEDLYLIYVDGESMEPTLRPGDVILVDRRGAPAIPCDGVYVLRMDGSLLVKRLQRMPGRRIRVSSDNPAYESFDMTLDDSGGELAVVGRVVWSGQRM